MLLGSTLSFEKENPMRLTLLFDREMSVWIQTDPGVILFDTDSVPDDLSAAVADAGLSLANVDAVVLSHSHNDHVGGLQAVLDAKPDVPIHVAPGLLIPPYGTVPDGEPEFIGSDLLHGNGPKPTGITTFTGTREVAPDCLAVNGAVGPTKTRFKKKIDGEFVVDRYQHESWLILGKSGNRTMLVGCSHPGVVTMLRLCREQLGLTDIHTLIGGLHSYASSDEELHAMTATLKELGIRRSVIGHCSGKNTQAAFRDEFGENATDMAKGLVIEA